MAALYTVQSKLAGFAHRPFRNIVQAVTTRSFTFSFAGPRNLEDILKKDMIEGKSSTEVADIWYTYHESKDNVHGMVLEGKQGKSVLSRAALCPFFIQPIFRDDGYFMMVSQFQAPNHFLMAYLEDFKMDPGSAQPLLTCSVFDDYCDDKDMALVRADILNKGIHDDEGYKVVRNILDMYLGEEEFKVVHAFNKQPEQFQFEEYVESQRANWEGTNDKEK